MPSILLVVSLVVGSLFAVLYAWPATGGIALLVLTALGSLGLLPQYLQNHRLEALFLFKAACLVMVVTGWGLGIVWNLQELQGADAALVVCLIAVGSLGLLALGAVESEVRATATLSKHLRVSQVRTRVAAVQDRPPGKPDPMLEISRYLEQIDPSVLRAVHDRQATQQADEDATSSLSESELRQVELWGERLRGAPPREDPTHLFSADEMDEMRSIARRLGLVPSAGEDQSV